MRQTIVLLFHSLCHIAAVSIHELDISPKVTRLRPSFRGDIQLDCGYAVSGFGASIADFYGTALQVNT